MAIYARKRKADILREALWRLEKQTPITATSPGSIARAFTEGISEQLGDFYDALEFNLAQSVISSASGNALDMLGQLYNVPRRVLSDLAATEARIGAFYFYLDTPHVANIDIPAGTQVFTAIDSFIGRQLGYTTTEDVTLVAGRTRVFVGIRPRFSDGVFSAAAGTLTVHNFTSPPNILVKCTNPKAISPQVGYESDDNYRLRIVKAIRVASSGTAEAVRFAGLGVSGVRDIKIRQAPYGMGTFEALVIPETTSLTDAVLIRAKQSMDLVRPVGVRMLVNKPTYISMNFGASIVIGTGFLDDNLVDMVTVAVMRYINTLLPGDVLVYNKLIQAIMDTSNAIKDVQVTSYAPNGVETVRRNFTPKENEQLVPGSISIDYAQ